MLGTRAISPAGRAFDSPHTSSIVEGTESTRHRRSSLELFLFCLILSRHLNDKVRGATAPPHARKEAVLVLLSCNRQWRTTDACSTGGQATHYAWAKGSVWGGGLGGKGPYLL